MINKFPTLISNFFHGRVLVIEGVDYVLVKSFSLEREFPMSLLIRRVKSTEQKLGHPCILYLDALNSEQRRQLIKHGVCFIVPDRQIYLPSLGTYFTERRLNTYKEVDTLTPSAQFLVLYHLQKDNLANIEFKDVAQKLGYPAKTISMVARELYCAGLCDIVLLGGRGKGLAFRNQGRELWEMSLSMMNTPIDKVGYVNKHIEQAPLSYDDALSHYTEMGCMPGHSYAVEKRSSVGRQMLEEVSETNLPDSVRIEFWKYSPNKLAVNGYIDPLSMVLIYKDFEDERVQGQIKRLLDKIL